MPSTDLIMAHGSKEVTEAFKQCFPITATSSPGAAYKEWFHKKLYKNMNKFFEISYWDREDLIKKMKESIVAFYREALNLDWYLTLEDIHKAENVNRQIFNAKAGLVKALKEVAVSVGGALIGRAMKGYSGGMKSGGYVIDTQVKSTTAAVEQGIILDKVLSTSMLKTESVGFIGSKMHQALGTQFSLGKYVTAIDIDGKIISVGANLLQMDMVTLGTKILDDTVNDALLDEVFDPFTPQFDNWYANKMFAAFDWITDFVPLPPVIILKTVCKFIGGVMFWYYESEKEKMVNHNEAMNRAQLEIYRKELAKNICKDIEVSANKSDDTIILNFAKLIEALQIKCTLITGKMMLLDGTVIQAFDPQKRTSIKNLQGSPQQMEPLVITPRKRRQPQKLGPINAGALKSAITAHTDQKISEFRTSLKR